MNLGRKMIGGKLGAFQELLVSNRCAAALVPSPTRKRAVCFLLPLPLPPVEGKMAARIALLAAAGAAAAVHAAEAPAAETLGATPTVGWGLDGGSTARTGAFIIAADTSKVMPVRLEGRGAQ
jgi:hypothetical protein